MPSSSSSPSSGLTLPAIERALSGHTPRTLESPRRASVAALLRAGRDDAPDVLLIRRAIRESDPWSGHMAFPGGREQASDGSPLATAIRETHEEIGVDVATAGRPIGRLDDVSAVAHGRPAGLVVSCFVVAIEHAVDPRPNEEVSEVLWAPLEPMFQGTVRTTTEYTFESRRMQLPAYDVEGRIVWGLTYFLLEALFARIRG